MNAASGADHRTLEARLDAFDFRGLHPSVRFGTASDRYAGWLGQIYPDSLADSVQSRRKKLGKKSYTERILPIESVSEFFRHFDVLELDFTFYRPLVDVDGEHTSSHRTLSDYAEYAPADARFLLKAPRDFIGPTVRRRDGVFDNPGYLDADAYVRQFEEPARAILGDRLDGIVFEQEYVRRSSSPDVAVVIEHMDTFFGAIGRDVQAHLELRSSHYLIPAYFDWLETVGIGFVFSHWTWLPPLRKQWELCGHRFTAHDKSVVVRLLTPLKTTYANAFDKTFPFDRVVPEIATTTQARNMILDTTALVFQADERENIVNILANNRAWGNAPELTRVLAESIAKHDARRRGQE